MSNSILDSGNRTEYTTGAVRDIKEDAGRCDLLPFDVVAQFTDNEEPRTVLINIDNFMATGNTAFLVNAVKNFCGMCSWTMTECFLEVSVHYKDGAKKYGLYNWQRGIPVSSYISSGVRHLLKYMDMRTDERHDRAFVWNMLGAIWTMQHKEGTDLIDIPFEIIGGNSVIRNGSETQHSGTKCRTMEHIQQRFERVM